MSAEEFSRIFGWIASGGSFAYGTELANMFSQFTIPQLIGVILFCAMTIWRRYRPPVVA